MNDGQLNTVEQVRQFLEGSEAVEFRGLTAKEKYYWIEEVLIRFRYHRLKRAEKGVIRRYIKKVMGYSRSQVSRLIAEYKRTGRLKKVEYRDTAFPASIPHQKLGYWPEQMNCMGGVSGPATKKIMEREYEVYGHAEFGNISQISVAHLYNLRRSNIYRGMTRRFTKTKPVVSKIGERAKPHPKGQPGHIRIDTLHQGDCKSSGKMEAPQ